MTADEFTQTSGAIAREARVSQPTVALYAKSGWLEFRLDSNGNRLFKQTAAAIVRRIYSKRLAARGRTAT